MDCSWEHSWNMEASLCRIKYVVALRVCVHMYRELRGVLDLEGISLALVAVSFYCFVSMTPKQY
mgnify:FL=1